VLAFYGLVVKTIRSSKLIEHPQTIVQYIRNRRIQLSLSQRDVAKVLEVSEDTITYWENSRAQPQIYHYPKIILFLGHNPFPVDTSTLSGRMKKYRNGNGASQEDLAMLVGVNESTIFSCANEEHKPLSSKLKLLEETITQRAKLRLFCLRAGWIIVCVPFGHGRINTVGRP
jgi:DNA-binding XRE family transcriptional regulator